MTVFIALNVIYLVLYKVIPLLISLCALMFVAYLLVFPSLILLIYVWIYFIEVICPLMTFLFAELMKFTTMSTKFSFDSIMYRWIDGFSLGSLLGPMIANIFVGFHEKGITD